MPPPFCKHHLQVVFLALTCVGSGCRFDNPSFGLGGPVQPDSTSTARDKSTNSDTTSDRENSSTQNTSSSSSAESSSSSSSSSSSTGESTPDQDTTSEINYPAKWNTILPEPSASAALSDHCKRGAKGCFVFKDPTRTEIESQTPGYPGMKMRMFDLASPASSSSPLQSPEKGGVVLNGFSSRIESKNPFPRYAGQNFGFELWYRSALNPSYNERDVMLFQILDTFWMSENSRSGEINCGLPLSSTTTQVIYEAQQQRDRARDELRYVACFIHNGAAYLYSNETMVTKPIGEGNRPFQVQFDVTDEHYAIGGWVQGNRAQETFQRFQGTIYMARMWNNMQYMQKAIAAELRARKIEPKTLEALNLSTP